jgi:hypothetical protein
MEPGDPEYHKIKNWVDNFMKIPFGIYKNLSVSMSDGIDVCNDFLENANNILNDCVYGLDDAKLQIMQMLGQWISNPSAMGTAIAIKGPMGTGKCHAVNTPIVLYDGTVKMVQDIVIGDIIMGDDSTPRTVTDLGSGEDDMYDIIPSKGDKYTVNSEHILCLKNLCQDAEKNTIVENYTNTDGVVEISVKDYLSLDQNFCSEYLRGYNASIEFEKTTILRQEPYVSGVTIIEYINELAVHDEEKLKIMYQDPQAIADKRVPHILKINTKLNRLYFISGIINRAGTIIDNDIIIESPSPAFIDDFIFIIRSLGMDIRKLTNTKIIIEDNDNLLRECKEYAVNFDDIDISILDVPVLSQITIQSVGRGNYYGFTLDANHRYVLGDFTVTHNTTLVKDGISKILGREFAFIALGGAGDSSFLEGHSYTYEGSTWGKIVQILMDSKCMNPVIYFDELDKISDSSRGQEIIGILTHLTDTSQNNQYHDKYFSELDFDLSKCLFIFSYNDENMVNPILKDRMYRIQTKGYDAKEKIVIARNYLLPKIREQVNFNETDVIIPDDTIQYIVGNQQLTKNEDGVRNLKRCLEIIYTKLNLFRLVKPENNIFSKQIDINVTFPFTVTRKHVDIFIKNEENQRQSILYSMYV